MINENNLYIRICKFGNEFPKGFTYEQIKTGLQIDEDDWESKIIKDYMLNALYPPGEVHIAQSQYLL
jgi:hypothetical protein